MKNSAALAAALKGMGYELVSGGTDNHLVLVDLKKSAVSFRDDCSAVESSLFVCVVHFSCRPQPVIARKQQVWFVDQAASILVFFFLCIFVFSCVACF